MALRLRHSVDTDVISRKRQAPERSLLRAQLATRQPTAVVIVFDDGYCAVLVRVPLDNGERAVGAKRLDGFRSAIVVIVANLAHQNAARILLNKIDLPVEVAVALYFDYFVASNSLDEIGFAVTIGIYRDPVFVLADPCQPLVGPAVAPSMTHDAVRTFVAGQKRES